MVRPALIHCPSPPPLTRAILVISPAAQLATYEFVATISGIIPFFDFVPSQAVAANGEALYKEPRMAESFTSSLAGPLWVDVKARKGAELAC